MATTSTVTWKDGMSFDAELNGHHFILDADEKVGGHDQGPRPKPLLLTALGGCTGMDVVSILTKMRVELDGFSVAVTGELTDEHPKVYRTLHLAYTFKGKDLDRQKLERAVQLSQERYCGVTAMLNKVAEVTYEIVVES